MCSFTICAPYGSVVYSGKVTEFSINMHAHGHIYIHMCLHTCMHRTLTRIPDLFVRVPMVKVGREPKMQKKALDLSN
jgi:hypothetical protein